MKPTKIFLDTEFTGLHQKTTLISIGIYSESGHTFYAELTDYDRSQVDTWIQTNVIDNLLLSNKRADADAYAHYSRHADNPIGVDIFTSHSVEARCDMEDLKQNLSRWLGQFEQVEVWSDCLSYDWVLFCNIFGNAFSIPKNVYYMPFDICTLFKANGIDPDINREQFAAHAKSENGDAMFFDKDQYLLPAKKHNALWDAYVIKECYLKLIKNSKAEEDRFREEIAYHGAHKSLSTIAIRDLSPTDMVVCTNIEECRKFIALCRENGLIDSKAFSEEHFNVVEIELTKDAIGYAINGGIAPAWHRMSDVFKPTGVLMGYNRISVKRFL